MSEEGKEIVDQGRRDAIGKLGAFAAFTVPTVSTLLVSKKATAQSLVIDVEAGPIDVHVEIPP